MEKKKKGGGEDFSYTSKGLLLNISNIGFWTGCVLAIDSNFFFNFQSLIFFD